ncbi:MAG: ABC transporter ATP-binding protein [Acidimicrobiales bacterium]
MTDGLRVDVEVRLGDLHLQADLTVAPGATVAVLGPNGAGKTTLLRAIAGLQAIDSGTVEVDGELLDDTGSGLSVPCEQRPIGVVFQDYLLFPHLSALDNVAFGLRCRGTGRGEARRRAAAWLERVGLGDSPDLKPSQLSGGQSQRVALARALVTEPRLLLLDEPLAALDAATRAATRRDLRRHLDGHPGVRIVVTHDPVEAASLADHLVVMESGRIVQQGSLAEMTARPRSRYVADLVGVNLLSGRGDRYTVRIGAFDLTVAEPVHGEVLVVIAPRVVTLHRRRPEGTARNVWEAVAETVDHENDRVRVQVGGPVPIVAEVTAAAASELALGEGGTVWVSVKATEIVVFAA